MSGMQEGSTDRPFIGRSVTRLEDLPLVTGRGRFAAAVSFPHQLHMRVVRSDYAHGKILSIDVAAALASPGCFAVWTYADVQHLGQIEHRASSVKGLEPYRQRALAHEFVRYVCEPIAVVFADDAYRAEDAAELVAVEIEELPPLLDAAAPPGEFAPGMSTEPTVIRKSYGDLKSAFAAAHTTIELELSIGRHSGVPLETRGAIARFDASRDVLELHAAAKRPHPNRDLLARILKREPSSIHLFEGHVGGGFGVRGEIYPEDVLVCEAALRLGRPVRWIEDRRENLMACNHSREQRHRVRAAVDADGRLLALDDEYFHDNGAYVRTHGAQVANGTAATLAGPYEIPAFRAVAHYRLTNKTPCGTYRSPGRFESTFVHERVLDAIAARLQLDPVEVRRRNLIPKSKMPYRRGVDVLDTGVVLDSGDYEGLLDKALAQFDYAAVKAQLQRRREAGELVGVGVGFFLEKSGHGPADAVRITVEPSGAVELVTGVASIGQGVETILAQICADALGVDYRRVRVIHGRTDAIAYGFGAHATRVTVFTGSATHIAATKLRKMALEIAASDLIEAEPESLEITDGVIRRKGERDGKHVTLGEVARVLQPAAALAKGRQPGLTAEGWFHSEAMNYPYGVHMAIVNVDRHTGVVRIERYLAAYDVGRAVNPMLLEGQLVGSVAQGLGGALLEEFRYDANGSPLSVTFADYLLPTLRDMPQLEVLITEDAPSPVNPLGLKGGGEAGITAVAPALAAAIDDAIGIPGAIRELPVTPMRLKKILDASRK